MKLKKALKNDPEGFAIEVLMDKVNNDKNFIVHIGKTFRWKNLIFYPDTGTVIYKGKEYVSRTKFTDIHLKRLEESEK